VLTKALLYFQREAVRIYTMYGVNNFSSQTAADPVKHLESLGWDNFGYSTGSEHLPAQITGMMGGELHGRCPRSNLLYRYFTQVWAIFGQYV
jgi:hypothetical protein